MADRLVAIKEIYGSDTIAIIACSDAITVMQLSSSSNQFTRARNSVVKMPHVCDRVRLYCQHEQCISLAGRGNPALDPPPQYWVNPKTNQWEPISINDRGNLVPQVWVIQTCVDFLHMLQSCGAVDVKRQSDPEVWLSVHNSGLAIAGLLAGHTFGSSTVKNSQR